MADDNQLDVMIAVYAMGGLAESDYEAIVDLVEAKTAKGVLLATQDVTGEATQVKEAGATPFGDGDGDGAGGGAGPGAGARKAVKDKVGGVKDKAKGKAEEKLGKKLGEKLSPGSGMMITVYEHAGADSVALALKNPSFASAASVDGHGPKALKAALEEASAGLPG